MTDGSPELTADDLRNALSQLQVYQAVATVAKDAHAALDAMLGASDPDAARRALEQRYGFTETQALAVLDLQFSKMTAMNRQKIEQLCHELAARVAVLQEELGGV